MVYDAPAHVPEYGVTVYTTVAGAEVVLTKVSAFIAVEEERPEPVVAEPVSPVPTTAVIFQLLSVKPLLLEVTRVTPVIEPEQIAAVDAVTTGAGDTVRVMV